MKNGEINGKADASPSPCESTLSTVSNDSQGIKRKLERSVETICASTQTVKRRKMDFVEYVEQSHEDTTRMLCDNPID